MATPGRMAKRAAKQTGDILETLGGLVEAIQALRQEVAELKGALKSELQASTSRRPAKK